MYKRYLPALLLVACTIGCVTLPSRYAYHPKTSDGVQCKSGCSGMYNDCKNSAMDSCIAWSGTRCTETAPGIKSKMESCISEEAQCLKVCEQSTQ